MEILCPTFCIPFYTPPTIVCHVVVNKQSPPTLENLKTNFDGAIFGESYKAGIGVFIRNFEGEVMAALSEKIKK